VKTTFALSAKNGRADPGSSKFDDKLFRKNIKKPSAARHYTYGVRLEIYRNPTMLKYSQFYWRDNMLPVAAHPNALPARTCLKARMIPMAQVDDALWTWSRSACDTI
jgi:hypothetical protein